MKIKRIFLFTLFLICGVVDILCWSIPVGSFEIKECNISLDDVALSNAALLSSIDNDEKVYLGGQTLGFSYQSDGVLVVAKSSAGVSGVECGDILKTINGKTISNLNILIKELNQSQNDEVLLKLVREGKTIERVVKPSIDKYSKKYKLGIWAKDSVSGIGTLTFVKANGEFGALGHPIVEPGTNAMLDVATGSVYKCAILGVKKATRGSAGELRGMILQTNKPLGDVYSNGNYGISGKFDLSQTEFDNAKSISLGGKSTIHPGKANIYSSIDGVTVRPYEIEIIKTNYYSAQTPQNFVFRVIDKKLIELTGGIVQGMSGSPIVQDDKLIGAVTHVFVNDATKGFGTYIDNMI
ncbi:MAG: SpoIVB peptidase [Clostridia bacterium]|nr:SpoIVB peptidase [Clostridia bacterium]